MQQDIPTPAAKALGAEKLVKTLVSFLESNKAVPPLSFAIHGEWGSGKTSILKTVSDQLDTKKIKTIFFEAWKHEDANPALALIHAITADVARVKGGSTLLKDILVTAANALVQAKFGVNLDLNRIADQFNEHSEAVARLSIKLYDAIRNSYGDKKLVIFIDDLDRCDVENTLKLLAIMKLFLEINNCICIAAVDFKRLEHAWHIKYGITAENDNEGRSYLEKIFQIRIGLPQPTTAQIKSFIEEIVPEMPLEFRNLMDKLLPANPRSIKRMLNLISFRAFLIGGESAIIVSILWTILEEILGNEHAVRFYNTMEGSGGFFENITQYSDWNRISQIISQTSPSVLKKPRSTENLQIFLGEARDILLLHRTLKNDIKDAFVTMRNDTNELLRL